MRLHELQRQLQDIYEIVINHDVDDFLISDSRLADVLDTSSNPRPTQEKLLVQQSDTNVHLSLYVGREVLDRLTRQDPLAGIDGNNIRQYCIAMEGVSHFLYLVWNVECQRDVTLLELELQAEVDKYVSLSSLLRNQNSRFLHELHHWLFEDVSFDRALDAKELDRYRSANRYAAKYCRQLDSRYHRHYQRPEMLQELRRFYRKTQTEKIRMIDASRPL